VWQDADGSCMTCDVVQQGDWLCFDCDNGAQSCWQHFELTGGRIEIISRDGAVAIGKDDGETPLACGVPTS
jgi:hypothetical protein